MKDLEVNKIIYHENTKDKNQTVLGFLNFACPVNGVFL